MEKRTIDVMLVTIDASVNWTPYINSMRPNGVFVFIGSITNKLSDIPVASLITKKLAIAGTTIGGSRDMKEMLQFVADYPECQPIVETMSMEDINEAIERVKSTDVRFRMAVEN
jgi:D-arabinose 1-dehydrogenase-like Zn-dependent alcohol dehydrogenase